MPRYTTLPAIVCLLIASGCTAAQPSQNSATASPVAATQTASPTAAASTPETSTPSVPPATASATLDVAAGYADLPGWIVFEHFGQKPDGTTPTFDFDLRMIWLVHADGSRLHELAPGKPADGKMSPDISPDGTKVLFSSWSPLKRIWEAPIAGGDPVLMTANCSGLETECQAFDPAYSADGKRIAYVHLDAPRGVTSIAIQDLSTGAVHDLAATQMPGSRGYLAQPSWSPDGRAIVYYRNLQTATDEHITDARLFVVQTDDSAIKELPQPAGRWAADPDWSPDGSTILFSSTPNRETEGWADAPAQVSSGLYTVHADATGLTTLCAPCLDSGWAPSWTSDGKHIFFWGNRTFAMMDRDGGHMAHINAPKLNWFANGLGFGYAGFLTPVPAAP